MNWWIYELVSKVNYTNEDLIENNINITTLLAQNIQDSCNWVSRGSILPIHVNRAFDLCEIYCFYTPLQLKYLVNNDTNVIGSMEFSEMVSSCAPEDVTRLHSYCYRVIQEKQSVGKIV